LAAVLGDVLGIGVVNGAGSCRAISLILESTSTPVSVLRGEGEELNVHGEDGKHEEESTEDETLRGCVIATVVVQAHAEASDLDALQSLDCTEEEVENNETYKNKVKGENSMQKDEELVDGILDSGLF